MITNIILICVAIYLLMVEHLELKAYEEKEDKFKEIIIEYNDVLKDIKETQNKVKEQTVKFKSTYNEMYLLASCTPAVPKECLKVGTTWEYRFVSYNQ